MGVNYNAMLMVGAPYSEYTEEQQKAIDAENGWEVNGEFFDLAFASPRPNAPFSECFWGLELPKSYNLGDSLESLPLAIADAILKLEDMGVDSNILSFSAQPDVG